MLAVQGFMYYDTFMTSPSIGFKMRENAGRPRKGRQAMAYTSGDIVVFETANQTSGSFAVSPGVTAALVAGAVTAHDTVVLSPARQRALKAAFARTNKRQRALKTTNALVLRHMPDLTPGDEVVRWLFSHKLGTGSAAAATASAATTVAKLMDNTLFKRKLYAMMEEFLAGSAEFSAHVPSLPVADTSSALEQARARGAAGMHIELASPDNLPLSEAALKSKRSEKHVNNLRNAGRLYALVFEGSGRGFRYPSWQFNVNPVRLETVLAALSAKGVSCWAMHDFLMRPHADLGMSPRQAIVDDKFDIGRIVAAVHQRFDDADQGAA